jgi:hypothetical protein
LAAVSVVPLSRPRLALRWQSFEGWVGTRSSAAALFALALLVFALQSIVLPAYPGRDMGRYVQTYVQYWYDDAVLPSVLNTRGPLASLGVGLPLELGGVAAEVWLALLYAASIVAWGVVALKFGPRAAILTTALLLVYPGYSILFHGLASDALFAAAFAGWAVLLSRAILGPSITTFLIAGLGMGALVLVRPSNQVLIVFALLPLFLRAQWLRRLQWVAAFFVASAVVTQGWRAVMTWHYGDAVALTPSGAVLVVALALSLLLLPAVWRRRVLWAAIPLAIAGVIGAAVTGPGVQSPTEYARLAVQSPPSSVFLFRAFEMDRIVSPENGPASREMGRIVERDLLTKEPYRSYGVDLDEFFSSGSDRLFADLTKLPGVDLPAVTDEAIRAHPQAFISGIAGTIWAQLWARRVFAPEGATGGGDENGKTADPFVVVNGRKLPRPSEGQLVPASHVGPVIWTRGGNVREVWRSATEHPLVFDDPHDERRYAEFGRDTDRLAGRIPTRDANEGLVHRLNQASNRFPPPVFWIAVGLIALAVRRPARSVVALALVAAALAVIVGTSLVALDVPEYSVPVTPAFLFLAAAGLVGADPRGRLRLPRRRS